MEGRGAEHMEDTEGRGAEDMEDTEGRGRGYGGYGGEGQRI